MNPTAEDLVEYALTGRKPDGLDASLAADPAAAREFSEIRAHLALHEAMPLLEPAPLSFAPLRARLEAEAERPPFVVRYWMPFAAAALVLLALLLSPSPRYEPLFGEVTRTAGNAYRCVGVSRIRAADGTVLTIDRNTEFELLGTRRLALRAGRFFLEAEKARLPLEVEAGPVVVRTVGTAFLVERRGEETVVAVESGEVLCEHGGGSLPLAAGAAAAFGPEGARPLPPTPARAFFSAPSVEAEILDPATLRIVVRNGMPDPITLAPPTGGEPLGYARYGGHEHPLAPTPGEPLGREPLALEPGESAELRFRLTRPVEPGEGVEISFAGVRARAAPAPEPIARPAGAAGAGGGGGTER